MKNFSRLFSLMLYLWLPAISCEQAFLRGGRNYGEIRLGFDETVSSFTRSFSSASIDTNGFILSITDPKGAVIYSGAYGDAPEAFTAEAGTYTVEVKSCDFDKPAFDCPQFGDAQVVVVRPGDVSFVRLVCRQVNAGIRLSIDSGFLTSYPSGVLFLKSDAGRLMYSYSEKRAAYFRPGNVSLVLSENSSETVLFTRTLEANDMLSLHLSVSDAAPVQHARNGGMSIQVDTSRNWISGEFDLSAGPVAGGSTRETAFSVPEARNNPGLQGVWVYGYIVGGDLTSANASFEAPFSSNSNICIASRSSVRNRDSCMSVQLPKGNVRDALNLVEHPEGLRRAVYLKGDITESYFGLPGIRNVTEYSWN